MLPKSAVSAPDEVRNKEHDETDDCRSYRREQNKPAYQHSAGRKGARHIGSQIGGRLSAHGMGEWQCGLSNGVSAMRSRQCVLGSVFFEFERRILA
jgi:hypothetical protein